MPVLGGIAAALDLGTTINRHPFIMTTDWRLGFSLLFEGSVAVAALLVAVEVVVAFVMLVVIDAVVVVVVGGQQPLNLIETRNYYSRWSCE